MKISILIGTQLTRSIFVLALLLCSKLQQAQTARDQWLTELNAELANTAIYDEAKLRRIDSLHNNANQLSGLPLYYHYHHLYQEFSFFIFDSAYYYAKKMLETALVNKDSLRAKNATLQLNQTLLSSGMFKEVFESTNTLNPDKLDNDQRIALYSLKARSYLDLADYNSNNAFAQQYSAEADRYIDSCLLLSDGNSFDYLYFKGLKSIRKQDLRAATQYFGPLAKRDSLSYHEQAILFSTFSDVYIRRELPDSAIILLARAAIADIRSSTRETTALLNLAVLLFKLGDVQSASAFIRKAADDAKTYGARQRRLQIGNVMPLIDAEKLATVEKEKFGLARYAIIITLTLLFSTLLVIIIVIQLRKLKRQQKVINEKNNSLHKLLEEKEWLLKEVHHRVKNNLHTINSLLESQSAFLHDEALAAIKDSQHRVFAMSLVHQKLYKPENSQASIDMEVYVRELVSYLRESFETGDKMQFELDLDRIELDIAEAVPLGLILNEAITNSVKYAFPEEKKGVINISVKEQSDKKIIFCVADNGIGLPEGFDPDQTKTLGLKLMKGLSEDIRANFLCETGNGTRIIVELTNQ